MSTFVCWLWRGRKFDAAQVVYLPQHVNVLGSMLRRHGGHRLVCVTPDPVGIDPAIDVIPMPDWVAMLPRYYPKLWAFSRSFGVQIGERFASIDLDCVVLEDLGPLLARQGSFIIWNVAKGEPYNSSFFVLEPGSRSQVWELFSPEAAKRAQERSRFRWTGDQSWIAHVLGANEMTFGEHDGVCIYGPKRHRAAPPPHAKVMFFCGRQLSPDIEAQNSAWVREAWC